MANGCEMKQPGVYEAICHEFYVQAMVCYEEEIAQSKSQVLSLTLIIGTFHQHSKALSLENHETLVIIRNERIYRS